MILKILPKLDRIFSRYNSCHVGTDFYAVDFSSSNILTDREKFSAAVDFWYSVVLNIMRVLHTLDGTSHYLYNNGTAVRRYITTE